jgi:hypothetical protein
MQSQLEIQSAVTQIMSAYLQSQHLHEDYVPTLLHAIGRVLADLIDNPIPEPKGDGSKNLRGKTE